MKGGRRWLWPLLALAIAVALAWAAPKPRGLRFAVHTLSPDDRTLALAREAGFDAIVQLFSWREIEPTRGQFHWQAPDELVRAAEYYGLDLVIRLDQHPAWASAAPPTLNAPPDDLEEYARFVSAVARRYRGRVLGYVIWNEPNLAHEWGGHPPDPAGYVALLKLAYRAVKEADPQARVVSAGLAPTNQRDAAAMDDRLYLQAMYEAGAREYFDVLGAHPYGFGHPPDDPRGAHEGLNMARLEELREIMVRYGDAGKPVWATEMGWRVGGDGAGQPGVTPAQQASYLVGAFERARALWPWLQLMAVWNLGGERGGEWADYSLLSPDGSPRPAYQALARMDKGWSISAARQALRAGWEYLLERWGRPRRSILAKDVVVHLGDSEFPDPWRPLYGARNPSPAWRGTFYLRTPGSRPWRLTMRVMQSNFWGNHVWINGHRLSPPLYPEDFSGSWISYTWEVPAEWLRPGVNELEVTIARAVPLIQDLRFAWDDVQFKDAYLWR